MTLTLLRKYAICPVCRQRQFFDVGGRLVLHQYWTRPTPKTHKAALQWRYAPFCNGSYKTVIDMYDSQQHASAHEGGGS